MFPAIFKIAGSARGMFKEGARGSGVGKQAGVILAFRAWRGMLSK